jgi:parvulin-like peptidyl-prolyl isomerase
VDRLKKELKVTSKHELDAELQKQGTSLASLRDAFVSQRMAREYLGAKAESKRKIGRQELLAHYQAHAADYAQPARVRWQQIMISFSKHGGKPQAFEVLNQAVEDLRGGADFGAVARKYSNGPTAHTNGQWDWMQAGSFADEQVEQELFRLPVGEISQVLEDGLSFQLVKVNERRDAGRTPFEEVQADIQKSLEQDDRQKAINNALDELVASSVVTTIFDQSPPSQPKQPDSPTLPLQ